MSGSNGHDQNPEPERGVGGIVPAAVVEADPKQLRRDQRDELAAWRARMQQGKQSVIEWLDANGDGPEGYARVMLSLRRSEDDRVRLGAIKLEAQLREWFSEAPQTHIDNRTQVVAETAVVTKEAETEWLQSAAQAALEVGRGEPDKNGEAGE